MLGLEVAYPEVISSIYIPLDEVPAMFREVRIKAVTISDPASLLITGLFVCFVVPMLWIKLGATRRCKRFCLRVYGFGIGKVTEVDSTYKVRKFTNLMPMVRVSYLSPSMFEHETYFSLVRWILASCR